MLEIDTPGHTYAMGKGYPQLLTTCYQNGTHPGVPDYPNHPDRENLDPSKESTYIALDALFRELSEFDGNLLHLGLDEVASGCWESSPRIAEFMREQGLLDYWEIEEFYLRRLLKLDSLADTNLLLYQDPLDRGVELNDSARTGSIYVEVWKDVDESPLYEYSDLWQPWERAVARITAAVISEEFDF